MITQTSLQKWLTTQEAAVFAGLPHSDQGGHRLRRLIRQHNRRFKDDPIFARRGFVESDSLQAGLVRLGSECVNRQREVSERQRAAANQALAQANQKRKELARRKAKGKASARP